jgi:hypothetical protein
MAPAEKHLTAKVAKEKAANSAEKANSQELRAKS